MAIHQAEKPSAGDVRFESTFTMDEKLLKEYLAAKDRSLNRRDGLVWTGVMVVVCAVYLWGTWLVGVLTAQGTVIAVIIAVLLVCAVVEAITGATVFWPDRLWVKTYQRYFARHGVDVDTPRPWEFTLRTSACFDQVRDRVMRGGTVGEGVDKAYKAFGEVAETDSLVVLLVKDPTGSMLHNMFKGDYADRLAARERQEDMVFHKEGLVGGTAQELVAYLESKIRVS